MMGLEFTGYRAVLRRLRALGDPGARRPADVEVARDRDRPAGPDQRRPAAARVRRQGGEFPAYGADAVRWGLLAMSSGQDVRFSEERIAQGQQLGNKLWNAARLVLLGADQQARAAPIPTAVEDRWMLSRLARAQAEVTRQLDAFDFSQAALALYDFVYGELCDWYLELVKPRLRASEPELIATLLHVLTETISLAHPIIPFETEEIWSLIPGSEGLLAQRVVPALSGAEPEASCGRQTAPRPRSSARSPRSRRCDAGATAPRSRPEPCCRRGWRRPATSRPPSTSPGWRACRSTATRRTTAQTPVAAVPIPGGVVEILGGAGLDRDAAIAKLRGRIAEVDTELDARPRQARQPGVRRQGAPARRPGRARQARAADRRAGAVGGRAARPGGRDAESGVERDDGRGGRALPAVAGAVRDAVRAGPDAPPDDRAGSPRATVSVDPRRRHQRQVLDDADDRGDPRPSTGCGPAPTCRRTCSRSRSGSGSTATTSPRRSSGPRSAAPAGPRRSSTATPSPTTR